MSCRLWSWNGESSTCHSQRFENWMKIEVFKVEIHPNFQVIFPMQKAKSFHQGLKMDRIYPTCHTLSATGRISLHEPNIQNIPRDFEILVTDKLKEKALGRREARLLNNGSEIMDKSSLMSSISTYLEVTFMSPTFLFIFKSIGLATNRTKKRPKTTALASAMLLCHRLVIWSWLQTTLSLSWGSLPI